MCQDKATLYKKLAAVMGDLSRIEKTGKNSFHGYEFATDADISDAVRPVLAKHGIALFVSMIESSREPVEIPGKNGARQSVRYTATFEFTFGCAETGATITSRWTGEALDTEDKGYNKCATAAEKYFFLKTFALSTGDLADDVDGTAEGEAAGKQVTGPGRPVQSPQRRLSTESAYPTKITEHEMHHGNEPLPGDVIPEPADDEPATQAPLIDFEKPADWATRPLAGASIEVFVNWVDATYPPAGGGKHHTAGSILKALEAKSWADVAKSGLTCGDAEEKITAAFAKKAQEQS